MPFRNKQISSSRLAFFLNPDGTKVTVLVRNYGAVIAVVLDDGDLGSNSVIRLHSALAVEFIEPYCDGLIDPMLTEQYDEIQFFLTEHGMTILGPLTSVRAAQYIKRDGNSVQTAIDRALQVGIALTAQQAAREELITDDALNGFRR